MSAHDDGSRPAPPRRAQGVVRRAEPTMQLGDGLLSGVKSVFGSSGQSKKRQAVTVVNSSNDFNAALRQSRDLAGSSTYNGHPDGPMVIVKFYASWCRTCKAVGPKYKQLAAALDDEERCRFLEVEFSANRQLCKELKVKSVPCMQLYRGKAGRIDTLTCTPKRWAEMKSKLQEYLGDNSHIDVDSMECILDQATMECKDNTTGGAEVVADQTSDKVTDVSKLYEGSLEELPKAKSGEI